MLKFIKHNMETIIGIEVFPIISFLIFFIFFIGLFVWVAGMGKAEINSMAAMPLEDDNDENEIQLNN